MRTGLMVGCGLCSIWDRSVATLMLATHRLFLRNDIAVGIEVL